MTHLEFLRDDETARLLERASVAAGTPVSIHYVKRNQEGPRVCGWGECGACRLVSSTSEGKRACRLSRTTASAMAVQQQRPISYLCHLGFACVAMAPFRDEGYVVTFGPFCPMEEQRSLEEDVQAGYGALVGESLSELPFSLDDVHRAPAASVPAVAGWLQEVLGERWRAHEAHLDTDSDDDDAGSPVRQAKKSTVGVGPAERFLVLAREAAAALGADNPAQARVLFQGHLDELGDGGARRVDVRRARVVALTAATLEALLRSGLPIDSGWVNYGQFTNKVQQLDTDTDLLEGAISVFSFLRKKSVREKRSEGLPDYPALYALVNARLVEGITLEAVARELGESPTNISHRLRRKFGMSYSEYVARIRVDRAKQLFRRSKLTTTEVAHRVGIADQSNFAKLFKKIEGVTPTVYRKNHGKGL